VDPAFEPQDREPVERFGVQIMSPQFLLAEDQSLDWQIPLVEVLLGRLFDTLGGTELDELVYAGFEIDDGSILYVAHDRQRGSVVVRASGSPTPLADLGPRAIEFDISRHGVIAFAVDGDGTYVIDRGAPRRIGNGRRPRFSPDGGELLVLDAGAATVIGLDGSVMARLGSPSAAWGCAEECER
jgi:hypothetical protein